MFKWWAIFKLKHGAVNTRRNAAEALGGIHGNQAVKALISALKDRELNVRVQAAKSLGKLGNRQAVAPLLDSLTRAYYPLEQRCAAEALGMIGDERAAKPLMTVFEELTYSKPKDELTACVAATLGKLGHAGAAVRQVIATLKDRRHWPRIDATCALVALKAESVAPFINALELDDWEVREGAAKALGVNGDKRAVGALTALLNDEYLGVRRQAAKALSMIGDARALDTLTTALDDSDSGVRKGALEALVSIGSESVKPLLAKLSGRSVSNQYDIIDALGMIGDSQAVMPLIAMLRDGHSNVNTSAITALGKLGDSRAVEPLIGMLHWPDSLVRHLAVRALDSLGWCPADVEHRILHAIASEDFARAVQEGSAAVEPLIGTIKSDFKTHTPSSVKEGALGALVSLGRLSVDALVALLKEQNSNLRHCAVRTLGEIGDRFAVGAIVTMLNDSEGEVRRCAADVLDKLGWQPLDREHRISRAIARNDFYGVRKEGRAAMEPLIAILRDTQVEVRRGAVQVLSELSDARSVEPLINLLKDRDKKVRQLVAEALGRISGARAVYPLIAALKDEDQGLRERAAEALGQIRDPRAVEMLVTVLRDCAAEVRKNSAEALGKIGDARAVDPLIAALKDGDRGVRERVAGVLGKIGDARAVDPLIAALENAEYDMREHSALALGEIGDARAVEPLITALKDYEDFPASAAAEALGKIGDARAVEPLIAALDDRTIFVRVRASTVLGKLGDARAVEPLIRELKRCSKAYSAPFKSGVNWALISDANNAARNSLIEIGVASVEPLITLLEGSERQWVVFALGRIGSLQAVEPLITMLNDSAKEVRNGAIEALGKIGGTRAMDTLTATLQHTHWDMRICAAEVIESIAWRLPSVELRILHAALLQKGERICEEGSAAIQPLLALLSHNDHQVRTVAVETLGKLGDARAVDPLILMLQDTGSTQVRRAAAQALVGTFKWHPVTSSQRAWLATAEGRYADASREGLEAVEPLALALSWDNDNDELVWALAGAGGARAAAHLIRIRPSSNAPTSYRDALHEILKIDITNINPDVLRRIAILSNVSESEYETHEDCWGRETSHEVTTGAQNYGQVRQLARQELSRRGLDAS